MYFLKDNKTIPETIGVLLTPNKLHKMIANIIRISITRYYIHLNAIPYLPDSICVNISIWKLGLGLGLGLILESVRKGLWGFIGKISRNLRIFIVNF